ncbi:MAG: hypothetical protein ABS81_14125 [Pseudonocardia sp. SCN 72-86]|nr:MAG: hypothetical protein ABS81_14125 [Pseudonocardia sp. SCN 72-86]
MIAGVTAVFALLLVAMLPRYRKPRFSLGFRSFTFPIAGAVARAVEWLEILEPAGGSRWNCSPGSSPPSSP